MMMILWRDEELEDREISKQSNDDALDNDYDRMSSIASKVEEDVPWSLEHNNNLQREIQKQQEHTVVHYFNVYDNNNYDYIDNESRLGWISAIL